MLIFCIRFFPSEPSPMTFMPKGSSRVRACPAKWEILCSDFTQDKSPETVHLVFLIHRDSTWSLISERLFKVAYS